MLENSKFVENAKALLGETKTLLPNKIENIKDLNSFMLAKGGLQEVQKLIIEHEKEIITKIFDEITEYLKDVRQSAEALENEIESEEYEAQIKAIYEQNVSESKKTLELLFGEVGYRKNPSSIVVPDEKMAVSYFKTNNLQNCIKESVIKSEVKKIMKSHFIDERIAFEQEGEEIFFVKPDIEKIRMSEEI